MPDRAVVLDLMIEFVLEELLSGDTGRRRALVRRLAERWPGESALTISFALTSATATIEDTLRDSRTADPVVPLGYRLSALVSADVHAIQAMGQVPAMAEDLLHFWRRADTPYLNLG